MQDPNLREEIIRLKLGTGSLSAYKCLVPKDKPIVIGSIIEVYVLADRTYKVVIDGQGEGFWFGYFL